MAPTPPQFLSGFDTPTPTKKSKVAKITKSKPKAVKPKGKKSKLPTLASFVKKRNELTKKF